MTRVQAVGVLLIVLGLIYALMYVGWQRRAHRNTSAAVAVESAAVESGAALARPPAPTLAKALKAEGTYISTTTATSRLERVAAAGLGVRARANMVVDENGVRWERAGADEVRVAGVRLVGVSLERGMAGKFVGQARIVVVSWRADNGKNGDRYATGFLPRRRADSAELVEAVQRLIKTDASFDDPQPTTDGTL